MAGCCKRLGCAVLAKTRGSERRGWRIGFLEEDGALSLTESSVNEDSLVERFLSSVNDKGTLSFIVLDVDNGSLR